MHALIDLDILQYEFGNATEIDDLTPLALPLVYSRVDDRISGILEATKATSYQGFLTSTDKSNFRIKIASIKPYKGHRATEKPYYYEAIREYLKSRYKAVEVFGMEADDRLGIEQCGNTYNHLGELIDYPDSTIICSLDKDLNMIPGWHYNWRTRAPNGATDLWWQDELTALKCFYSQLLTGDSTDNILGLFGVGEHGALVKRVKSSVTELDMYSVVRHAYDQRFGHYGPQFLLENAKLLWILREDNVNEVEERMSKLEAERLEQDEVIPS